MEDNMKDLKSLKRSYKDSIKLLKVSINDIDKRIDKIIKTYTVSINKSCRCEGDIEHIIKNLRVIESSDIVEIKTCFKCNKCKNSSVHVHNIKYTRDFKLLFTQLCKKDVEIWNNFNSPINGTTQSCLYLSFEIVRDFCNSVIIY